MAQKYHSEGIEGLLTYPYKGSSGKLTQAQVQQLEQELCKDQMQDLQQVCDYVEKKFKVHYTTRGMAYVFERLKVKKKKTGRPLYHHKDFKGEKKFKKKVL